MAIIVILVQIRWYTSARVRIDRVYLMLHGRLHRRKFVDLLPAELRVGSIIILGLMVVSARGARVVKLAAERGVLTLQRLVAWDQGSNGCRCRSELLLLSSTATVVRAGDSRSQPLHGHVAHFDEASRRIAHVQLA